MSYDDVVLYGLRILLNCLKTLHCFAFPNNNVHNIFMLSLQFCRYISRVHHSFKHAINNMQQMTFWKTLPFNWHSWWGGRKSFSVQPTEKDWVLVVWYELCVYVGSIKSKCILQCLISPSRHHKAFHSSCYSVFHYSQNVFQWLCMSIIM